MENVERIAAAVQAVVTEEIRKRGVSEHRLAELTGIPTTTLHRRLHRAKGKGFEVVELLAIGEALGLGFTDLALRAERAAAAHAA